jgi:acyl-CoA synthetase (AMP-forming)/AMP-acid ligase II
MSDRMLHDLLDRAAAQFPRNAAVRDIRRGWNYGQLAAHSDWLARWLCGQGVGPGDRVAAAAIADCRVVAMAYACSRLGATFVPLNPEMKDFQRNEVLADAAPVVTLAAAELMALPCPGRDIEVSRAPTLSESFSGFLAPALLMYTSGSTSVPKGVICPHPQVLFAASAIASRLQYQADDVIFCRLPLSFDYGLYQAFLCALAAAELVLAAPASDAGLLAAIRHSGATVVPVLPSLARIILRLSSRDQAPSRVRLFTNTGQELPQPVVTALRQRFPGARVQLMYGITECKRVSILDPDGDLRKPGSVGTPLAETRVYIADYAGNPVPPGTTGEIVVAGPHVMAGYWHAPDLTSRVFGHDPRTGERVLHTGDYGRLDEDGHIYFHGRRDDIFKSRGVRTSALEIEAAACDVPGVTDAAVMPPADGKDAVLYVVASIPPGDVLRGLRSRLDPAKIPPTCRSVTSLPHGSTGKLDRAALTRLEREERQ